MAGRPVAVFLAGAPISSEYCITGIEQRVATTGLSSSFGVIDSPAALLAVMITVQLVHDARPSIVAMTTGLHGSSTTIGF
jgi:hypothetical protein